MSQEVPQIDTFVCMPIRGLEPTDRHVDLLLTDSGPTSDQLTRGAPPAGRARWRSLGTCCSGASSSPRGSCPSSGASSLGSLTWSLLRSNPASPADCTLTFSASRRAVGRCVALSARPEQD